MNNLFSHDFNTSPILCSLSPFLLGMVLGHRGLPGLHAAPPVGSASRCGSDPAAIPPHAMGAGSVLDRAGRKGKGCPWWGVSTSVVVTLAAGSGGWEGRWRLLGSMHRAEAVPEPGRDAAVSVHGHSLSVSLWASDTSELTSLTPNQDPSDLLTQRAGLLPEGRSCVCCWHCRVYRHSCSILIHPWSSSWVCAAFTASCTIPKSLLLVLMLQMQLKAKKQLNSQIQAWVFAGHGIRKTSLSPSKLWKFCTKILKPNTSWIYRAICTITLLQAWPSGLHEIHASRYPNFFPGLTFH